MSCCRAVYGRSRRADLAGVAEGWQGNGVSVSRGLLGMPCQSRQSSYSTIWESHLRVLAAFARPGVRAAPAAGRAVGICRLVTILRS